MKRLVVDIDTVVLSGDRLRPGAVRELGERTRQALEQLLVARSASRSRGSETPARRTAEGLSVSLPPEAAGLPEALAAALYHALGSER